MLLKKTKFLFTAAALGLLLSSMHSCKPKTAQASAGGDAAAAYVAPGSMMNSTTSFPEDSMVKSVFMVFHQVV